MSEIDGRRAFALPGSTPRYGPDKTVDVLHIALDVEPDLNQRHMKGSCTTTIEALDDEVASLRLDAVDLFVDAVHGGVDGGPLRFTSTSVSVTVFFDPPLPAGTRTAFTIDYRVDHPRRGLYFTGPTAREPRKPMQAWTQSQDQDARMWFPCLDYPHEKQPTTTTITVREGLFALGNGALVERRDADRRSIFRYDQELPHATYLMTMVAGEFVEVRQPHPRVPVFYYVPPGREADGERSFGKTPQMIDVFEDVIGVPYPYARYSQIAVADFTFGGMENTSATTQTDRTLHDERAHLDFSSDPLVSHELAHQWFGDLVTCRDWAQAWLNEGFATYFEAVFAQADLGWDEYLYTVHRFVVRYLSEDSARYRRPIVYNVFRDPIELFDRHLYEKGAAVLHMLRGELGWDRLRRVFRRYVRDNAQRNVETLDFVRAIEAETGRNMRGFFDQWIFRGGHPEVKVAYRYDLERKAVVFDVTQTQGIDADHPPYQFELRLGIVPSLGTEPRSLRDAGDAPLDGEIRRSVRVERAAESFVIPCDAEPALVRVDPGAYVLGTFDFAFEAEMLVAMLTSDPDPLARVRAAQALAKKETTFARAALANALVDEPFWGTASEIAAVLGNLNDTRAERALIDALGRLEHPKVRRAIAVALGAFRDRAAADALLGLRNDPSYFVVAAAYHALGRTRDPRAYDALVAGLATPSWSETIAGGAAEGLAELADERAVTLLIDLARESGEEALRRRAAGALARAGQLLEPQRTRIVDALVQLLDEPSLLMRSSVVAACELLGDPRALAALDRLATVAEPSLRRDAAEAALRIREGQRVPAEVAQLRADLESLRAEQRGMVERLVAIEARANGHPSTAPSTN